MDKISKNIEMTGKRTREYDQWRAKLPLEFVSIPFLDYARIAQKSASDWPIFNLLASIYPSQTESNAQPTNDDLRSAFHRHKEDLMKFNLLSGQIGAFHSYMALMNRSRELFLVQPFPRKDKQTNQRLQPTALDAAQFVQRILKQTWKPDHPELAENPQDNPFKSYSAWHRQAMPSSALVMDIDYVEIRSKKAVAVIEAIRSNTADLCYGLFSFLSRGFAQASVILMVAEDLAVGAYLVTYPRTMNEIEVLQMDRSLIPAIDAIDRDRQQIANREMRSGKDRKTAQGIATRTLYNTQGKALMEWLLPHRKHLSITDYKKWLDSL